MSIIAEKHREEMPPPPPPRPPRSPTHPHISEKSALSQPEVIRRNSLEIEYSTPRKATSTQHRTDDSLGSAGTEENTAVGGLLRTIQRPLSSLGRMFSEDAPSVPPGSREHLGPPRSPPRLSPAVFQPPRRSDEVRRSIEAPRRISKMDDSQNRSSNAEDAAARQAVAEAAEAQRLQRAEHRNVVELVFRIYIWLLIA